ncbi:Deoxynucleoside kinase [Frankliniella fusca]|uniref:Deoxynucleoside kinase n=1 Tax=Frankliniella fusca TaxID=407009 RepID=A0AAE1L4Y9_9NEOP|nr:Deoxynucleoside kinase [Frankliniella fusca]
MVTLVYIFRFLVLFPFYRRFALVKRRFGSKVMKVRRDGCSASGRSAGSAARGRRGVSPGLGSCYRLRLRIFERSARCALDVFSEYGHAVGAISRMEMETLRVLLDAPRPEHPVVYLYVRVDPGEAWHRSRQRDRPEESSLPASYLTRLHRHLDD